MGSFTRRRFVLAGLALTLALGGWPQAAYAQEAGRRLAFFVGVSEYDHDDLKSLPYTERDVEESG